MVKPFGFELDDKHLKRAGLDYWQHLPVTVYENEAAFFTQHHQQQMAFFSSHGNKDHWSLDFEDGIFLVFGKESAGLSQEIIKKNGDKLYKIPLYSEHIRSLNVANAVGIIVYEGLRQLQ